LLSKHLYADLNMKPLHHVAIRLSMVFMACLLNGCGGRSGQTKTDVDTTTTLSGSIATTKTDSVCYQQVVGRDTTTVRLFIAGTTVTGELAVLPAEKDRATGTISGTRTNDRIVADWQRSGEGVTQVHEVNFTLRGDSLLWREGERVEKQGKWTLVNPDEGFQYKLVKTTCPR
jgi:hypothetical protein